MKRTPLSFDTQFDEIGISDQPRNIKLADALIFESS